MLGTTLYQWTPVAPYVLNAALMSGVVLFVFVKDHKSRIEVGYGLEGALPDITARHILDDALTPRFRAGVFGRC